MLAGLEKHQSGECCGCEQRLPWCWTEEAATWISQQLGLLVFHIAVWFGYCSVVKLAVLTDGRWKLAAIYCNTNRYHHVAVNRPRIFYTLQNARQQNCKYQSDSGQQVSSLHDSALEVTAVCLLKVGVWNIIWHCGLVLDRYNRQMYQTTLCIKLQNVSSMPVRVLYRKDLNSCGLIISLLHFSV